jgi:hypothetical protein
MASLKFYILSFSEIFLLVIDAVNERAKQNGITAGVSISFWFLKKLNRE